MMQRKHLAAAAAVGLLAMACGAPEPLEGPRLVVVISVDQLPFYLLEQSEPELSGGLRRLLDEGFNYSQAVHDHAR